MMYGLGIPTRGPRADRGSIEAVATCAEAPGFSRLALSDHSIPPRAGASRCPCTRPGAFPDSVRFATMPMSISNVSLLNAPRVRLPRRLRSRGPRRW